MSKHIQMKQQNDSQNNSWVIPSYKVMIKCVFFKKKKKQPKYPGQYRESYLLKTAS